MSRNPEVQKKICSVFEEKEALTTKEIIKRVSDRYSNISQKQIYNFLWNAVKKGILKKDEDGKYCLMKGETEQVILENKMYDQFKKEIDQICEKYMKNLEDPFSKFKGADLLEAQRIYDKIKSLQKIF